ncbi:DUF881 domain-containing protein [Allocatelliglobosispora scoriae]|uniref:DUF881 domain-containing protein n=1 Tax=Allocatelliglobosispora scoriae TaxID=643052 RepID=UPI0016205892|nr:DUF881 domain-containing protein [Allocatelliglobosispora scoriae]
MEYTSGTSSWRKVLGRAISVLRPRGLRQRKGGWALVVPVIMLAAGVLFTTSATTAKGTSLREDRRPQFVQLIGEEQQRVALDEKHAAQLRAEIGELTERKAGADTPIAGQIKRGESYLQGAGLTALKGPGVSVRLNDAPVRADGTLPDGATKDDVVVHQQDVQAVVNALWAGGAEAMTIMNVRIISTSVIRCVGNTLLLDGRVYSPAFEIRAIGNQQQMRAALDSAPGVRAFQDAARDYGLDYRVANEQNVLAPAYTGSVELNYAEVPQ